MKLYRVTCSEDVNADGSPYAREMRAADLYHIEKLVSAFACQHAHGIEEVS